ncbi:PfaD family polyunsaturated fatty acid/polyketide biosynthesis protein [Spirillospora sp. NPDC048911]|uniref:PfaD family polyunsaturated fatty acid/polyketide biosynthesis protein n=1 Tax=Spirillospora sp. NPDC048911 TaxID=3364527 RepID=UPI0037167ADB
MIESKLRERTAMGNQFPAAFNSVPARNVAGLHQQVHFDDDGIAELVAAIRTPLRILMEAETGRIGVQAIEADAPAPVGYQLMGMLPALDPERLGDADFCSAHQVRFPYIAGEMANGIATTRMVRTLAETGLMGFFGAAGLGEGAVEHALTELTHALAARRNWGVNLIHAPYEPRLEDRTARALIRHRVPAVSASAYLDLTPALVLCAAQGLRTDRTGRVFRPRRVLAKVSRPETAGRFMSPAPVTFLRDLVDGGDLSEEEARLAARVPVAEDVTVEADSGGHTDNRALVVLFPAIRRLGDTLSRDHGYATPVRVGAAGGLGTPAAVAAAFALGAAYVLTGSINQAAVESGLAEEGRNLLAQADLTDVTMAPAADMFEMGVRLQVLRRGTMFAGRATQLHDLYTSHASLEDIPPERRARLEREVFGAPLEEVWADTCRFWNDRNPAEIDRARHDARHRMALVFRWYLGRSSRWAIDGDASRRTDYQIWCGPAMGAFNRWAENSFLADPANRGVVQIALNLLEGAAAVTRAHQARTLGVPLPRGALDFVPRRLISPA